MNILKRLIRRFQTSQVPQCRDTQPINAHIRRDLGIDQMAMDYQRDARLWQRLAS